MAIALIVTLIPATLEAAPKPKRIAWAGVSRGPLSPADAAALERAIDDTLRSYEQVHLVDAAGHPMNDLALARDTQAVKRLIDQGIDRLLNLDYDKAERLLDSAIAKFEDRLTALEDQSLLHEALLAKAETQEQKGRPQLALTTLERLAALNPKRFPKAGTHLPPFVKLYAKAKQRLGRTRSIMEVHVDDPRAEIQVDGRRLGAAPVTTEPLPPGRHYVVARWSNGLVTQAVQLAPGKPSIVQIERDGPPERMRKDLLDVMALRKGEREAKAVAKKLLTMAEAKGLLSVAVHKDGEQPVLLIGRHDRGGNLVAVGRLALRQGAGIPENLPRLLAALFIDGRKGDFEITEDGAARDAKGGAALLFGGKLTQESAAGQGKLSEATLLEGDLRPEPVPVEPELVLTEQWWFWAAIGVVVVAGAGATLALTRPDPNATLFDLRFP